MARCYALALEWAIATKRNLRPGRARRASPAIPNPNSAKEPEAAGKLQAEGLIKYSRGKIIVLDRNGLEACVCECYAVLKKEYDRLLPAMKHA